MRSRSCCGDNPSHRRLQQATRQQKMQSNQLQKHLLYFADPMCSWCYGFAPVITALAEHFAGRLPVKLVMGGLRAGNTRPMQPQDKDYIRNAWTRVHAAS